MLSCQLYFTGNKAQHSHSYCFHFSTLQHLWVVEKCFANYNVITAPINTLLSLQVEEPNHRGHKGFVQRISKSFSSRVLTCLATRHSSCPVNFQLDELLLYKNMCVYIYTCICFPKWEEKKEQTFTSFCWDCTGRGRSRWSWLKGEL